MKLLAIVLVGVSVLATSSPVRASTLYTPPVPGGGSAVFCQAVNVSAAPRIVTISIFASNGLMVNTTTCSALAVSNSCSLAVPGAGPPPHHCRIDVDGAKTTVRGSIVRTDSTGVPAVALPAQ